MSCGGLFESPYQIRLSLESGGEKTLILGSHPYASEEFFLFYKCEHGDQTETLVPELFFA